jgi:putative oxidoreductase
MLDLGLLVLRTAGFLLAFTFGIQKIGWYMAAFHSDKAFSSIGLVPLIAKMGFPAAVILALWVTFNESVGAFLIGCGLFTRVLACSAALGMAGALYTSVRIEEDWLRAALYLIAFAALSLTGPGRFSIDQFLQTRKTNRSSRTSSSSNS